MQSKPAKKKIIEFINFPTYRFGNFVEETLADPI